MNADFDFKAKGYESAGDWSRLWDLVPPVSADTTQQQRDAHAAYEKGGQTKPLLLALLATYGVKPEPYDAKVVATRNVA